MRLADRHQGPTAYQSSARTCEAPGCRMNTREGKPYCLDHVELNPHAKQVTQEIAQKEAEDSVAANGGTPASGYNTRGITASAILQHLAEHGTRTKARLCRELVLERKVLDGYAEVLIRNGLLEAGTTQRGNETLSLPRPRPSSS